MQLAGLLGSLTAPILYSWISGYVLAVGGVLNLLGLAIAAPVLYRAWRDLKARRVPAVAGRAGVARRRARPASRRSAPARARRDGVDVTRRTRAGG